MLRGHSGLFDNRKRIYVQQFRGHLKVESCEDAKKGLNSAFGKFSGAEKESACKMLQNGVVDFVKKVL